MIMITYKNIQCYKDIPFEEYLKLQGYSHSFLKSNINGAKKYFNMTDKVRVGALVDSIITEPAKADMSSPLYPAAKTIAFEIKKLFGDLVEVAQKQLSYTATLEFAGLEMQTTGRLDLLIPDFAVIDLKVTNEINVDALIEYMGYDNQVWHYSRLSNVKKAFLIFYVVPLKKVVVRAIDVTSELNGFWINKLIDFGTACAPADVIKNNINQLGHF
jgi:hypothetical protein